MGAGDGAGVGAGVGAGAMMCGSTFHIFLPALIWMTKGVRVGWVLEVEHSKINVFVSVIK